MLFVAGVLLVEFAARNRLGCRHLCPQADLLVLAKLANPWRLKVRWQASNCICGAQSPCARACSLSLDPKSLDTLPETECTNCGDCIVVCKKMGKALGFRFSPNGKGTGPGEPV